MSGTGWSATGPAGTWIMRPPARPTSRPPIASEIGREVDYRPVATDGAARAAAMLAELL